MDGSCLAALEVDAGIDPDIGEVGEEADDEAEQTEDVERAEDHRIVALERALVGEAAEAVEALPPGATRDGLASLPERYLDWALEQKAPDLAVSTAG